MPVDKYIPAGRTSRVTKGDISLQVQTEYADRPSPRITTTVIRDGQVLQKIERNLDRAVSSADEQALMEMTIKRQHQEVCRILEQKARRNRHSTESKRPAAEPPPVTIMDRLKAVCGVTRVWRLDVDGNFVDGGPSEAFRQQYAPILENLGELLDVFLRVPGVGPTRETGVYEIERDSLYLVSAGPECYIITVEPPGPERGFETEFKLALFPRS